MGDTAKQFSLQNFRPEGFGFPTGLNVAIAANTVVDYLVVAGGGGGGHTRAGGGGAGGFLTGSGYSLSQSTSHTIIVGAGGAGSAEPAFASNGSYSFINVATTTALVSAIGGGFGARGGAPVENFTAGFGGSGGGGAGGESAPLNSAGLGTPGQGNNGGAGSNGAAPALVAVEAAVQEMLALRELALVVVMVVMDQQQQ
jgi:hypothetical protein